MQEEKLIIGSNSDLDTVPTPDAVGHVVAMQLAAITYCSLQEIGGKPNNASVAATLKAYLPDWKLVWAPVNTISGNYAIIVHNGEQFAIAIRGSIINLSVGTIYNWLYEDLNLFTQLPWNYPGDAASSPMISQGAADGLAALAGLQDANGDTMLSYLQKNAFPNEKSLCVTGHSLGGNLSVVFSLWLKYQMQQLKVRIPSVFSVVTFAAPSSWNQAFADQFDAAFPQSWRYFNIIDLVPFSATNILGIQYLFPGGFPAPTDLQRAIFDAAIALDAAQVYYGSVYAEVNTKRGSIPLNRNRTVFPSASTDPLTRWFDQASAQHDHNHYLQWLGGRPVNCSGT